MLFWYFMEELFPDDGIDMPIQQEVSLVFNENVKSILN